MGKFQGTRCDREIRQIREIDWLIDLRLWENGRRERESGDQRIGTAFTKGIGAMCKCY